MLQREKVAMTALRPLDAALGAMVEALRKTVGIARVTDPFYQGMKEALKQLYTRVNALEVEGLDKVPSEGGVVFAVNHQSWGDVQVVSAACPRRLRFLTKSEFEVWPVLRHLVALSDSPFIQRGGDASGMEQAVEMLQQGKAMVIFPEGTIPGEEGIGRHRVEPQTGLLRGHTGAVRLAVQAGVPVVPVGISGTGKAFPPEIYPRLELLELPNDAPITVRFGAPMDFEGTSLEDREAVRRETDRLMGEISKLVDHDRGYVPIPVPSAPLPKFERLGVLVLHGFTGHVKTMSGIVKYLEDANLPYRLPVLRGHGGHYTDMEGVTSQDWYDDAEAALLELYEEVDKVVVVGLSMGGLVTLNLGIRHPDKVAGVATMAAALRFKDPLSVATPFLAKVVKSWPSPDSFHDAECRATSENYPRFMTSAFVSLYEYSKETEERLRQLEVPLCVLQSKRDQVVSPISANIIYRDVSSKHREIHWFERSGHEMGQDMERDSVFETVMTFVERFVERPTAEVD